MKYRFLVTLLSSIFVAGCGVVTPLAVKAANEASINQRTREIPPYTPSVDPEVKEIESVEIVDMPENNVLDIGYFDTYHIGYKVNYTDGTSADKVEIHFDDLPNPVKDIMSVPGDHNVALQIRGVKTDFPFTNHDTGDRYTVQFKNYDESTLYSYQIMPYAKPVYEGETPRRPRSGMVKFNFSGWDIDLDTYYVKGNIDINAQYNMVPENNDYVGVVEHQIHIDDLSIDESTQTVQMTGKYALYYAGRMNNVPIIRDRLDPVQHTKGQSETMYIGFNEDDKPKEAYELYNRLNTSFNTAYSYNEEGISSDVPEDSYRYISCTNIPGTKFFEDFTVNPIQVTNILGEEYTTTVNNLEDYVDNMFENEDLSPDVQIPAELESGSYCPTIYLDIDLYLYVSVNEYPNGNIGYRFINVIPSPCGYRVDLGVNEDLPSAETSTDREDFMNLDVGDMFEHCKNIGKE